MTTAEYHGIPIDRCPTCGGILLDKGEAEAIDELDLGAQIEADTAKGAKVDAASHCHSCDNPMIPLVAAGDVEYDWCDKCERLFFDRGELAAFDAAEAT